MCRMAPEATELRPGENSSEEIYLCPFLLPFVREAIVAFE